MICFEYYNISSQKSILNNFLNNGTKFEIILLNIPFLFGQIYLIGPIIYYNYFHFNIYFYNFINIVKTIL